MDYDFVELQLLPQRMAAEGAFVLHAALVSGSAGTIALTGPSGIGKSSLSAGLRALGWTLMGDDTKILAAQGDAQMATPLFPRLRLRSDAAEALIGGKVRERGVERLGKHVFNLESGHPAQPIAAIFLLDVSPNDEVTVMGMRPADACFAVLANCFAGDATDTVDAGKRLGRVADLVTRIPVFRLAYPRNFAALPRVADAIAATLEARRSP